MDAQEPNEILDQSYVEDPQDKNNENLLMENLDEFYQNLNMADAFAYDSAANPYGPTVVIQNSFQFGSAENVVTSGDLNINQTVNSTPNSELIAGEDLAKVEAVYIESSAYTQWLQALKTNHVLILSGKPKSGKLTTALSLLLKIKSSIIEVSPDANISEILHFAYRNDHGYVIDSISLLENEVEVFNKRLFDKLSKKLRSENSFLVITINDETESYWPSDLVAKVVPPVNREQMFDSHLEWYVNTETQLAKILALKRNKEVKALYDQIFFPKEIDELAFALSQVVNHNISLDNALDGFRFKAAKLIKEWFEDNKHIHDRAFLIALAVFSGTSFHIIDTAAKQLMQLLQDTSVAQHYGDLADSDFTTLFELSKEVRLEKNFAQVAHITEQTEFGPNKTEVLSFSNSNFQSIVLHHIWSSYPDYRSPLLKWLREYGEHALSARAAAAVGELAKADFKSIRGEVLIFWSKQESADLRKAIALALSVAMWDEQSTPKVLRLLKHWSTINNRNLNLCASFAYSGPIGRRFLDSALMNLKAIVKNGNSILVKSVGHSLLRLFDRGRHDEQIYEYILQELVIWSNNKHDTQFNLRTINIFLFLCENSIVLPVPHGNDKWPTLLWLVGEPNTANSSIDRLMFRSLMMRETERHAFKVLYQWTLDSDKDDRLFFFTEKLLKMLGSYQRQRTRNSVLHYLKVWANDPTQGSRSAKLIHTNLSAQS